MINTFFGLRVFVQPSFPKMRLSPIVPVTEEFRQEFDLWLADFFGYECLVKNGEVIINEAAGFMVMNKYTLAQLKSASRLEPSK